MMSVVRTNKHTDTERVKRAALEERKVNFRIVLSMLPHLALRDKVRVDRFE
jgi:hypothetical protein